MLLLYKSYNYINKHFLIKSRVEGRGSRVVGRGGQGGFRETQLNAGFIGHVIIVFDLKNNWAYSDQHFCEDL